MKKYKKYGLWLAGALLVLLILPFFIPTETYLREAEKIASDKLATPVKLSAAQVYFLPTPHLTVKQVAVGDDNDLTVSRLKVTPTLSTLFSSPRVIDVTLEDVTVKKSAIKLYDGITASSEAPNPEPAPVVLRHLVIENLKLDFPDLDIPVTHLYVSLLPTGLDSAKLETVDHTLVAMVAPMEKGHRIQVTLDDWVMPLKQKLKVDAGQFEMQLNDNRLNVSHFDLHLYEGDIKGNALLTWGKSWQASGEFAVKQLKLDKPTQQVSPKTYMRGRLDGSGYFSAKAKEASALVDRLMGSFQFTVHEGVLHGVDLVKAASLLLKQNESGGETQFDQFKGKLSVAGKQYKLTDLDITSGLIAAEGHVTLSPKEELSGTVDVQIKKGVSLVSVPLDVSGTLEKPFVFPNKSALAGAAVGTAVLGPGVGTSLGVEASKGLNKLKGLFGGDEE